MRWRGRRESDNVEDRRGQSPGFRFPFPGSGRGRIRLPSRRGVQRGGGIGIVGMLILFGIMLLLGIDPRVLLQGSGTSPIQIDNRYEQTRRPTSKVNDDLANFVKVVLADTEDVWHQIFRQEGGRYSEPKLVLFTRAVRTACGTGQSAMGPFYCPADRKVYIDLSFYRELKDRFQAPGDFAQAYVIAHEVGHHVQTLLGIAEKVQRTKLKVSKVEGNRLQVRMELQADCFAGWWAQQAQRTKNILEPGDIKEALNAASAIGDDRIQKRSRGFVVPDSFTHGSSEQRVRWFKRGFENGSMQTCNTFSASTL